MNEQLKVKTTEELRHLMRNLLNTPETSEDDADVLYAIVDELMERGDMQRPTEKEKREDMERIQRAIEKDIEMNAGKKHGNPEWLKNAIADARANKLRKRLRLRRYTKAAVFSVIVILLANTITFQVSGFNPITRFLHWTGFAITGVERTVLEYGAWEKLKVELDSRDIQVSSPEAAPQGWAFSRVDIVLDFEPYCLSGWLETDGGTKEMSLTIDGIYITGNDGINESDSLEPLDSIFHNNMEYLVYGNKQRTLVRWEDNGYHLALQGDITYSEAEAIIKSIEIG